MFHHRPNRPAHLILNKMCATLCLLVIPLLLSGNRPARAGTWRFTCTGSGSATFNVTGSQPSTTTWTPPSSSTGTSYSLPPLLSPGQGGKTANANVTVSAVADISASITLTWTHGAGQTDANDPAPPSVMLIESSSATWVGVASDGNGTPVVGTGKADDGIKDAEVPNSSMSGGMVDGGLSSSANAPKNVVPPSHWTSHTVSGGTLTLSPTLHANASATVGNKTGGCIAEANLGGYTVSIHPTPYNWHITSVVNNNDGSLTFYYDWLSTTGYKPDLTSCYAHEYVTYQGPVGTALFPIDYTMPVPFYGTIPNPFVRPGTRANGIPMTGQYVGSDQQKMPALSAISPHRTGGFTATQTYQFDDTATGDTNVTIPGPDSGPLSIVRSVYTLDSINWFYSLTKSGYTITKPI